MVTPKVLSSPKSARPPLPGSAKSNLKDTEKSGQYGKAKSASTVEKSASKEVVAAKRPTKSTPAPAKSTTAPAQPRPVSGVAKSDSKVDQQVGVKQQ